MVGAALIEYEKGILLPFQKILLSFFVPFVSVSYELVDSYCGLSVRLVVGVLKGELLQFGELTFNFVEPGGIGRCPDQGDLVLAGPTYNLSTFVG